MSRVQMDPTNEDVAYFLARGFTRDAKHDLNEFHRTDKVAPGWTEQWRIIGRPYGWIARRTKFNPLGTAVGNWCGAFFPDPITCYVDAEVQQWGAS